MGTPLHIRTAGPVEVCLSEQCINRAVLHSWILKSVPCCFTPGGLGKSISKKPGNDGL